MGQTCIFRNTALLLENHTYIRYGSVNFPSELYGKELSISIIPHVSISLNPCNSQHIWLLWLADWEIIRKQYLQLDMVSLLSRGPRLFQWFLEDLQSGKALI